MSITIGRRYFLKDGKPFFVLGTNYWPRHHGAQMWEEWDPAEIEADIAQMKELGLNTVRMFLLTPYFTDAEGNLREEALEKFAAFVDICKRHGVYVMPSLFVGHMSGTNWDVPWRKGRDFYTDPEVLRIEVNYVREIARRFRDEPAILAWILSNEIQYYAGHPSADAGHLWARTLIQAIREADPNHPVSTGDGGYPRRSKGVGIMPEPLVEEGLLDYVGPHDYPDDVDELRLSLRPGMLARLEDIGIPVLLEEFGRSTAEVAEEELGDFFRTTLYSLLANGAAGALAWCFTDFTIEDRVPYVYQSFELRFGITRADRSLKPSGEAMREFATLLSRLGLSGYPSPQPEGSAPSSAGEKALENACSSDYMGRYRFPQPQAAILVPEFYRRAYPFKQINHERMFSLFLEAFTLAKMAHIDVGFYREPGELAGIKLLLMPCTREILSPSWRVLKRFVEEGGVLYLSYTYDMCCPVFEELFGARRKVKVGLPEAPSSRKVTLRFIEKLGEVEAGEEFSYPVPSDPFEAAYCPLEPTSAEVVAVDDEGNPAILVNRVGEGAAVFSAYPLEKYLLFVYNVHQIDRTYRLYRAIFSLAGMKRVFDCSEPCVELASFEADDGHLLLAINHGRRPFVGAIETFMPVMSVKDVMDGREMPIEPSPKGTSISLDIPPKRARVLKIHLARRQR